MLYIYGTICGVVLDLVLDTSASTFSNSLKKIIFPRGFPQTTLLDNGTPFTKELTQKLQQYVISNGSLV